jgi:acylphosphatase
MKHIDIRVKGEVQGVFFREETKKKANSLSLAGFIRNEPDGSVYIEAEGEETLLDDLVLWCKEGPQLAKVEDLKFQKSDELKGFEKFEVRI